MTDTPEKTAWASRFSPRRAKDLTSDVLCGPKSVFSRGTLALPVQFFDVELANLTPVETREYSPDLRIETDMADGGRSLQLASGAGLQIRSSSTKILVEPTWTPVQNRPTDGRGNEGRRCKHPERRGNTRLGGPERSGGPRIRRYLPRREGSAGRSRRSRRGAISCTCAKVTPKVTRSVGSGRLRRDSE